MKTVIFKNKTTKNVSIGINDYGVTGDAFIQECHKVFGRLAEKESSREWWATDLASKNRFKSGHAPLIQQYLSLFNRVINCRDKEVIETDCDSKVLSQLKKNLPNEAYKIVCAKSKINDVLKLCFCRVKKKLSIIYNGIRFFVRGLSARINLGWDYRNNKKGLKDYYVIKTFISDSFDADHYSDAIFGRLPQHLQEKENVLVLGDIMGKYLATLKKIRQGKGVSVFPVEMFVSFAEVIRAVAKLLFLRIQIKDRIVFLGHDITEIINQEFFETHNGIQIAQYLHYEGIKNFLKEYPAKCFLQTYENNPWERMSIMAIRECNPETRIAGYQQTVVPQASMNVFISPQEREFSPLPDRILTAGQITKDILEHNGVYPEQMIYPACALRHEYLSKLNVLPRKKEGKILVALEGIKEVKRMVHYVIEQLERDERFEIMIRIHPFLPWSRFKKGLNIKKTGKTNIVISKDRTLEEDIRWSDVVIYWGSTVVLEALRMGRPVIHFDNGSLLSFDPLFNISHLKWKVSGADPLAPVIQEILEMDDKDFKSQQDKALEYIHQYFWPVSDTNLAPFESKNLFDQSPSIR